MYRQIDRMAFPSCPVVLALLFASALAGRPSPPAAPPTVNVHVVPHTHDDVGWLKTVDQYYTGGRRCLGWRVSLSCLLVISALLAHTHAWPRLYVGSNNTIQTADVRTILSSVLMSLASFPDRKFTYVEQAFFQRWYREQDEAHRAILQKVVDAGQLVFVNGGWYGTFVSSAVDVQCPPQTLFAYHGVKTRRA